MTNVHGFVDDDREQGARSDAQSSGPPGGGSQKEQEPARARRVVATDARRSDAEIRVELDALLARTDAVDADGLELLVTDGVVVMLGQVPDYPSKRALEQAVADVAGVREIHDQLQVRSGSAAGDAAGLRGDPPPNGSPDRVV